MNLPSDIFIILGAIIFFIVTALPLVVVIVYIHKIQRYFEKCEQQLDRLLISKKK